MVSSPLPVHLPYEGRRMMHSGRRGYVGSPVGHQLTMRECQCRSVQSEVVAKCSCTAGKGTAVSMVEDGGHSLGCKLSVTQQPSWLSAVQGGGRWGMWAEPGLQVRCGATLPPVQWFYVIPTRVWTRVYQGAHVGPEGVGCASAHCQPRSAGGSSLVPGQLKSGVAPCHQHSSSTALDHVPLCTSSSQRQVPRIKHTTRYGTS